MDVVVVVVVVWQPGSLTYPSFLGRPFFFLSIRPTPNANNEKIGGPTEEKKSQEKDQMAFFFFLYLSSNILLNSSRTYLQDTLLSDSPETYKYKSRWHKFWIGEFEIFKFGARVRISNGMKWWTWRMLTEKKNCHVQEFFSSVWNNKNVIFNSRAWKTKQLNVVLTLVSLWGDDVPQFFLCFPPWLPRKEAKKRKKSCVYINIHAKKRERIY